MKELIVAILLLLVMPVYVHENVPRLPNTKEFSCLVENIYQESVGESFEGKVAVGLVTLNRVKHVSYPHTICAVVYQKNQFSWTSRSRRLKINTKDWYICTEAAVAAIKYTGIFDATHYHTTYVKPKWKLRKIIQIGNHVFYAV